MSPQAIICGIAAFVFLCLSVFILRAVFQGGDNTGALAPFLFCVAATGAFGYWSYLGTTPAHMAEIYAEDKARRAAELREQTPHVIREADGCKVYAFKSGGRYHYFTRCPSSQTTTESSWDVCTTSGNVRTCKTHTESIANQ